MKIPPTGTLIQYPVLLLLLLAEGIFVLVVTPLPPEYSATPLHLARYLSAIACLLLLPGWPLARLVLARAPATPVKVAGLGLGLNAIFYSLMIRTLHSIDSPLLPSTAYGWVAGCSVAALGASWWLDCRRPLRFSRLLVAEVAVGLLMVLAVSLGYARELSRVAHRFYDLGEVHRFLQYQPRPGATLRLGQGFRKGQNGRWLLTRGRGELRIHNTTPDGPWFPLRLNVMWTRAARLQICGAGFKCTTNRLEPMIGDGGPARFHKVPMVGARLLSVELPVDLRGLHLRVTPAPTAENPLVLEDYSNILAMDQRVERFLGHNDFRAMGLIQEAYSLMDHAWDLPEFLLDHCDMLMGYLMYSVIELHSGRSMVAANLLFLALMLFCYLLVCEAIRDAVPAQARLAMLYAVVATLPLLLLTVLGANHSFLPDALFSAFLLSALILFRKDLSLAFVLATIPAVLTRSTGIFVCCMILASGLLTGVSRRRLVWLAGACLLLWTAIFFAGTYEKLFDGLLPEAIRGFLQYGAAHKPASVSAAAVAGLQMALRVLLHSSGLVLFLLYPRSALGKTTLLVVLLYAALLGYSTYQPLYRVFPLVLFCAVGAGANVLSAPPRPRKLLLGVSLGLGGVLMLATIHVVGWFI